MLYPNHYVWLVFFSALDIMLTWVVLWHGGREVNALADSIIRRYGLKGIVAFKFILVVISILICEAVGRRQRDTGRRLAVGLIVLSCVPVAVALVQLLLNR